MTERRQERPAANRALSNVTGAGDTPNVAPATDALADIDALAEHLRGRFVVQTQTDGDKYRTRIYMSAKAAENAVRRGNARGKRVHVSLCQLLPVGVVVGLAGGSR